MIDAYKFSKLLNKTELSAEEFWLMYRLVVLEPHSPHGKFKILDKTQDEAFLQFSQWSEIYQGVARIGRNLVKWDEIALDLEQRGFLEIWQRTDDKIELSKIKVTAKFKELFAVTDLERAFSEFYQIYPKSVVIQRGGIFYPSMDKDFDIMVKIYSEKILKGNSIILHERCLLITAMYIKDINIMTAPYKMTNYFDAFEEIARTYERGESPLNSSTDNSTDV